MDEIYTMKIDSEELKHHGVLGMKWGRRRYQNKDGSLTEAGKKRVAKLDKERRELTGRTTPFAKKVTSGEKKSASEMTDSELKKAIERYKNEKNYADAKKAAEDANRDKNATRPKINGKPKKVKDMTEQELQEHIARMKLEKEYTDGLKDARSKGNKFVSNCVEKIGENAIVNIGTQAVNSGLTFVANKLLTSIVGSNKSIDKDTADAIINEFKLYTNNKRK